MQFCLYFAVNIYIYHVLDSGSHHTSGLTFMSRPQKKYIKDDLGSLDHSAVLCDKFAVRIINKLM